MSTGVDDSGALAARCVTGGLLGGLVASAWAALYAQLAGLPYWSPLAMYHTRFLGFAHLPVSVRHLAAAVATGITWQILLGMALGALFALVAGTVLPAPLMARRGGWIGALYGLVLWALVTESHLPLASPPVRRDLPAWAIATAFALIGAAIGIGAAHGLADEHRSLRRTR